MNILLLAAGAPLFDPHDGGYPLILTDIHGRPLLEQLMETCAPLAGRIAVVLREEDCRKFHLDAAVQQLSANSLVVPINRPTSGAACTALMAACQMDMDAELLILSCNEVVEVDFAKVIAEFRAKKYDAGTISFSSIHPQYSFVRLDDKGHVVEAAEKRPISRHATAGFYWFKRSRDFLEAVQAMIRKDAHVDGRFFICPAFNQMILQQKVIGIYPIDSAHYHPLKTERQIQRYEGAPATTTHA